MSSRNRDNRSRRDVPSEGTVIAQDACSLRRLTIPATISAKDVNRIAASDRSPAWRALSDDRAGSRTRSR